jgi:hypothetical protein
MNSKSGLSLIIKNTFFNNELNENLEFNSLLKLKCCVRKPYKYFISAKIVTANPIAPEILFFVNTN